MPERRSSVLIATFANGYAVGWKMAVPEAFRTALDIQFVEKTISLGKSAEGEERVLHEFQWTQGRCFAFKEGDTFWDVPDLGKPFSELLKTAKLGVQVIDARPAEWVVVKRISTVAETEFTVVNPSLKRPKPKTVRDTLSLDQFKWTAGYIKFRVLRPSTDGLRVEPCGVNETTQERFVTFLQTGILWLLKTPPLRLFSGQAIPDFVRLEEADDGDPEDPDGQEP